jgi:small GTP-binding protein
MSNDNNKEEKELKIIVLGECGVGKTNIITRYFKDKFNEDSITTTCTSYIMKIIKRDKATYRLNIWDTAGQEKFRSLGRNFYKDAFIICIIFDITNKQTFDNVKEIWYPEIQKYGEKYNILSLVGNKCDLYEDEEVEENDINSFAEKIGGKYFLVSAKNGNGIEEMFKTLAKMYLNPNFKDKLDESRGSRENSVKLDKNTLKNKNKRDICC